MLQLLRGGRDGVHEWNRRREAGAAIPNLREANLKAAGLIGADLSNANLNDAGLSKADLSGAELRNADLSRADLEGAKLYKADLGHADLHGAVLRKADLRRADLRRADLSGADLRGADLRSADLRAANLDDADLRGTPMRGAYLIAARLRYAKLTNANLSRCYLTDADLRGCDAREANFGNARITRALMKKARLDGAFLGGADLRGADLRGADLRGADLSRVHLGNANLYRADLTGAHLGGANLSETDLRETVLRGARLNYTVIASDLSLAQGLDEVVHEAPSVLSVRSILSCPTLPLEFLRGCGLREQEIAYFRAFDAPPDAACCYVSYCSADAEVAEHLCGELQQRGIRCWRWNHDECTDRAFGAMSEQIIASTDRLVVIATDAALLNAALHPEVAQAFEEWEKRDPSLSSLLVQLHASGILFEGWKQPRKADRVEKLILDARGWQEKPGLVERLRDDVLHALTPATRAPEAPGEA